MWWALYALGFLLLVVLCYGLQYRIAKRRGRTCDRCKHHDEGFCYGGLGWEPIPPIRTCSQWKGKEDG